MEAGSQIGAYRVAAKVGEGGMGMVWLAEHVMLGRRAALKMLHARYTAQPELVTRFFNEARAAAAISDPGIVQIFDFGFHTDGTAYIAMEMLDGEALDRRLDRLHRLGVIEALRIVRQLATSLAAAHERGIIHRDLKPENVFLVRDAEVSGGERAKILDFGIAKLVDARGVKTHTAAVLGTPAFMSPEQCRGSGSVDHRTDIYSLGCLLFTLLAGRPPFVAEGAGELISMHLREPAPALSSVMEGMPRDVERLVARCLEKDPGRRYSSAAQLAADIERILWLPEISTALTKPLAESSGSAWANAAVTTLGRGAREASSARGRRGRLLWGGAAMAVVGGVLGGVLVERMALEAQAPSKEPPPPQKAPALALPLPVPKPAILSEPEPAEPPAPAPAPSKEELLLELMADGLKRFATWATVNVNAPCPSSKMLGLTQPDPWGNALRVTCSEQPSDEKIGLISAGEDGRFQSADDVFSWKLEFDRSYVKGPHWGSRAVRAKPVSRPAIDHLSEIENIPRER